MSAMYSGSVRAMSPHRKTLLAGLSRHDTPALSDGTGSRDSRHSSAASAAFSTSCRCNTSGSQSTYAQSSAFRKGNGVRGVGKGRGRLSSWTKGNLGSIFNGLGSLTGAGHRFVDEMGRLIGRGGKKAENGVQTRDVNKMKVVFPIVEEVKKRSVISSAKALKDLEQVKADREQHSFEKAMTDTNESITSFYHAYTLPDFVPSRIKDQQKTPAQDDEGEAGWKVLRKLPLAWNDNTTAGNASSKSVKKKKPLIRKDFVSRSAIEARTKALVTSLKSATSYTSKINRTQDLCKHLKLYASGRHEATEQKVVPVLLAMTQSKDEAVKEEALEALALLGYTAPVAGRGIRILTLDGGGTRGMLSPQCLKKLEEAAGRPIYELFDYRGMLSLQCLKKLEETAGRPIYELFDYVCGVSTGALIAAMVCLYRLPLDECRRLYMEFSRKMFSRSRVMGTGGLVWNHSFYDSDQWEQILQNELGEKTMIQFSRDPYVPKMSAISTLINMPRLKNFVFRNYNLPPSTYSAYPGSCAHKLWEVIRASSAAPGYYEDFPLGDYVHSDGGISINNPTAMAVHESRLLWPHETIQCVVSIGTGRYEPQMELSGASSKVTLKEKVSKIVDSATDTEGVHVMMTDLMPPGSYFRFNPYLSEDLQLDEIRQDRLDGMRRDATMYLRKNEKKMLKAADMLKQGRMAHQLAMDWVKLKVDSKL